MRFENYKLIIETATSVCDAAAYMKSGGDSSVPEICKEALAAISSNISNESAALKSGLIPTLIEELSINLNDVTRKNIDTVIKLAEQLHQACITDLNYKIKVLIVAELGGKWDSLASVYEELTKREDCEIEVVIEPVYRAVKLPDGSIRSDVVLEDFLTPMGIKNIPYQQYDIAVSKPDITFYSQPYDSCTVPMFRTENLAKHSRLVYCPYFLATTISAVLSSAQDSFFRLPAQEYAWRIAGQSERMKKYYEIYASRHGENVIASGIPKLDYPLKLNKDNTPCPAEWIRKIKDRKVFLWNSHFSSANASANDKDGAFTFEKEFISIFKQLPNVALIWRPHPMTETVLKVYSPEGYKLYCELQKEARASDNIIIDQNATYDASFVWSDVLISSAYSSIVDQYAITGKPYAMAIISSEVDPYEKYYTVDGLFDFSKVTMFSTFDSVKRFVLDMCSGNDVTVEGRKYIKENFFDTADGNAGNRFVSALLEDFYAEEFPPTVDSETVKKVLVVGDAQNSKPCIETLKNNGVCYCVCDDYIDNIGIIDNCCHVSIKDVKNKSFDCAIITDKANSYIISRILTTRCGISSDKVIDFWKMYRASLPTMVCDRVMMNPKVQEYEGIILGISHTEVGILADKLQVPFCNLAVSSQDIYYQLKTLQYCVENYADKLKTLKYAIVDFYDYKYFNFDTSLSASAVKYISFGGYNLDAHNFARNENYPNSYEEYVNYFEKQRMKGITDRQVQIWNELFSNVHYYADYNGFCGNFDIYSRLREVTAADVEGYNYTGGSARKKFPDTIAENTKHIRTLFDILKSLNKDIKIYGIIIPKFIEAEVRQAESIAQFVGGFNKTVSELQSEYDNFALLDFNKISDISCEKAFYYDAAYLNYFGAKYITEQLNEIIFS